MVSTFIDSTGPITATLARWGAKCNSEMEKRVRFDFEIPLTEDLINAAPKSIQRAIKLISDVSVGVPSAPVTSEYDQTIELYPTPDHASPVVTFSNVKVTGLQLFRPTPKEGPTDSVFLSFSVNVKAEGPYGTQLVTWAFENMHGTVFFRAFDVQGNLPLVEEKPASRGRGKTAAAADAE